MARRSTAFVGEIEQIPPAFSAVKVDGVRAYDLAREGVAMELKPRRVVIHDARVDGLAGPDPMDIEIECGKGTYVRALVRDLAAASAPAAMSAPCAAPAWAPLPRREGDGAGTSGRDVPYGEALEVLLPVETALDDIPALAVTTEDAFRLTQGRSVVLLPRQVET